MIDPHRELVARQVPEHHDHVGAQPIGDDRHQNRYADKYQAPLERGVVEVGEQGTDGDGCNQVANPAAGLDHGPVAGGNHELQSVAKYRNAAEPHGQYGEVRGPLHHLRHHELADRRSEKQEPQRKRDCPRDPCTKDRGHRQDHQRHQRQMRQGIDRCQLSGKPRQARRGDRQHEPGVGRRRHARKLMAHLPGEPKRNRGNQEAVGESLGADPDAHHRQPGLAVPEAQPDQYQRERQQRAPPDRATRDVGGRICGDDGRGIRYGCGGRRVGNRDLRAGIDRIHARAHPGSVTRGCADSAAGRYRSNPARCAAQL